MGDTITRQVDFDLTSTDEGDGLTLEGYGAVFNTPTRIDSYEGRFDEAIAPGAFRKTLSERGDRVVLQFDHGQHPFIGSMPIGRIEELREDSRGLYVKARLFDNELIRPVRDAIAGGAIKGMSFRFSVVGEKWDDESRDVPMRTVTELKLFEVGPVVFPAYEATTVGVRSDVAPAAAQFVQRLHEDETFRQEATRLLTAAPELVAALSGTAGEGRTSDDAAESHVIDRTADIEALRASISKHIQEDEA